MDPGVFKYEKKNNVQNWLAIEEIKKKAWLASMGGRMKLSFVLAEVEVVSVPCFLCMHNCWICEAFGFGFSPWLVHSHCQPHRLIIK